MPPVPIESLVEILEDRRPLAPPYLIGVTGGVAVGKSTFAARLSARFGDGTPVIGADSFLLPNSVLEDRGLTGEKGFPDSFDHELLRQALLELRAGGGVDLPVYSHLTYDIDPGARRQVPASGTVVVEGLHLTRFAGDIIDVVVHIEADERDNRRWYIERFCAFCAAAIDQPDSFYRMFLGMSEPEQLAVAELLWEQINVVNLRRHIAPWRDRADIVLSLDGDHGVASIRA